VSRDDRERILEGCTRLIPSLADAVIQEDWVGLRPGRTTLRLEIDAKYKNIIHNYGHGGAGLTLGWGCAGDVVEMLGEIGVVQGAN
jgi:glycine/D-amino acid oxidase-like deaminating enzyme